MKMKSLQPHEYAGRKLNAGDEFDCEEKDVKLLTALQRAEAIAREPQGYLTRDMSAGSPQPYNTKRSLPRSARGRTP